MDQSNIQKPQLNLLKDLNFNDGSESSDNFLQDVIQNIRGNNASAKVASSPIETVNYPSQVIEDQISVQTNIIPSTESPSVEVIPAMAPPIQSVEQLMLKSVPEQIAMQAQPVQIQTHMPQTQIKQAVPTIPLSQIHSQQQPQQSHQYHHSHHVQKGDNVKHSGNGKRVKFQGLDESNFFNVSSYKIPKTTTYLAVVLLLIGTAMWFMLNKEDKNKDKDKDKLKRIGKYR